MLAWLPLALGVGGGGGAWALGWVSWDPLTLSALAAALGAGAAGALRLWRGPRMAPPPAGDPAGAGAEEPFRRLADNALIGFLVAAPGLRPLYMNQACKTLLGINVRAGEAGAGDDPAALHTLAPFLPPAERALMSELEEQLLSGALSQEERRLEVVRADLETRWLWMTARPERWDGCLALVFSFQDQTEQVVRERELEFSRIHLEERAADMIALAEATHHERERAEAAHQETERQRRFLQTLVATIPSPLYYKDPSGRILGANEAFARLYGLRRDADVVGKTVHLLSPDPAYAQRTDELDQMLFHNGGSMQYERVFRDRAGNEHTLIYNKAVFTDETGEPAGLVGVITDISEQKRLEQELRRLATRDSLTGALNRRAFMDEARRHISLALRHGDPLSVILADIDHFKRINDTHGHAVGDVALKTFVEMVSGRLRESDVLGRMGGEEFAILLPHTAHGDALGLAESLRLTVAGVEIPSPRGVVMLTVSQGVAALGVHGRLIDTLLHAADEALYVAKAEGRNRVVPAVVPS